MTHLNWNSNSPSAMQMLHNFVTTCPQYYQPNNAQMATNGQLPFYNMNYAANGPSLEATHFNYPTNPTPDAYYSNHVKIEDKLEITESKLQFSSHVKSETNDNWADVNVKEEPCAFENVPIKNENFVDVKEWIDLTELAVKPEPAIEISDESDDEVEITGENSKTLYKGAPKVADLGINPEQLKELKCEYCTYTTQWRNCMNRHVANKHEFIALDSDEEKQPEAEPEKSGDWKFKCEHCSYKTNWKGNMRKHVISRHKSDEEIHWFECAHCPYKGKTKEYLRFHLLSAHDKVAKWHECEHCSFRAKQRYVLKKHVIINHTASEDIEWFQCEHCPYKGKVWENLRSHLQTHHTKDGGKKFECSQCPFKTNFKKNLRMHVINKHTREDLIQWLSCDKCLRKFKTRKFFKQHEKTCFGAPDKETRTGTREIPVVMGNKICFKRVPVEVPLKDRTVQIKNKSVPVKEMLCKCSSCIPP